MHTTTANRNNWKIVSVNTVRSTLASSYCLGVSRPYDQTYVLYNIGLIHTSNGDHAKAVPKNIFFATFRGTSKKEPQSARKKHSTKQGKARFELEGLNHCSTQFHVDSSEVNNIGLVHISNGEHAKLYRGMFFFLLATFLWQFKGRFHVDP